jgi:hypothetical protein
MDVKSSPEASSVDSAPRLLLAGEKNELSKAVLTS